MAIWLIPDFTQLPVKTSLAERQQDNSLEKSEWRRARAIIEPHARLEIQDPTDAGRNFMVSDTQEEMQSSSLNSSVK